MKQLSWVKKALYSGVIFFGTVIILTIGYAAYVTNYPSSVATGSGLTASEWNKMVTGLQTLDTNLSTFTILPGSVTVGKTFSSVDTTDNDGQSAKFVGRPLSPGDPRTYFTFERNGSPSGWWGLAIDASNNFAIHNSGNRDFINFQQATGNIGIGTASPVWDEAVSIYKGNNNQVGLGVYTTNGAYTNSLVRVQTETAPSTSWKLYEGRAAGGSVRYYVDGAGNGWFAGTVTQSSDERLKKDITPIENPLDKISQLRGVSYYWKDKNTSKNRQIGVIAQEVEKVFPEAVSTDEKGMKSVSYGNLVGPLIEAVKELKKENDILKSRLDTLEQK